LPPGMRRLTRWLSNLILRQFIGVTLPKVPSSLSTSTPPQESWIPLPLRSSWLSDQLVGRWSSLLDTGPLKDTLEKKFGFDPEKIARSEKTLLINATNVRTGERAVFSNHPILSRHTGEQRPDVIPGITLQRILASCSIPLIYPWTYDEETTEVYWDGAVVANTPLSGALDAAQAWPAEIPMEVVVVLMTPWLEREIDPATGQPLAAPPLPLPSSFSEALTFTLDWALLATFRERLRVTEAYNRLARLQRQHPELDLFQGTQFVPGTQAGLGTHSGLGAQAPAAAEQAGPLYREVDVVVVAPERFFPAARIIDYDERTDQLIQLGYQAAQRAFEKHFR